MSAKFTATTEYNENLFYHRAMALKTDKAAVKKKSMLGDLEVPDLFISAVAFGIYFFALNGMDVPTRIFMSGLVVILFITVIRSLNRMRRRFDETNMSDTALQRNARMDLSASGQDGEEANLEFYEESFVLESPGMHKEFRYEGIEKLKETEEYFMIFRSNLTVISVGKSGIRDNKEEELARFLEEKCGKKFEIVRKIV